MRFADRDWLRAQLDGRGIGTAVHYDPIPPRLEAFAGVGGFPVAERLAAEAVSLPFDAWLTDAQLERVSEALVAALESAARRSSALSRM